MLLGIAQEFNCQIELLSIEATSQSEAHSPEKTLRFVSTRFDYHNALYVGSSSTSISRLLDSLKIILFSFKTLNELASPYISELLHPYIPTCFPRWADQLLRSVSITKRKLRGDCAFLQRHQKYAMNFLCTLNRPLFYNQLLNLYLYPISFLWPLTVRCWCYVSDMFFHFLFLFMYI